MYMLGFMLVLGCTLLMCLAVIIIQWIIAKVGVVVFAFILVVMSILFLFAVGGKDNDNE